MLDFRNKLVSHKATKYAKEILCRLCALVGYSNLKNQYQQRNFALYITDEKI